MTLLLAALLGALAQRSGLCMVKAVERLRSGRPGLLVVILSCGLWFWLASPLLTGTPLGHTLTRYAATWPFALGGVLFGLAAAFNQGCTISTLTALSRGQYHMLATMTGWVLGWVLLSWLAPAIEYQSLDGSQSPPWWLIGAIALGSLLAIWRLPSELRRIYALVVTFGAVAGLLGVLEPAWSPSRLLEEISTHALMQGSMWPDARRVLISIALIVGATLAATQRIPWRQYRTAPLHCARHLAAGTVMGAGSALALGGNDSQLLLALPAGSPAAALALSCMIAGIWLGLVIDQRIQRRATAH